MSCEVMGIDTHNYTTHKLCRAPLEHSYCCILVRAREPVAHGGLTCILLCTSLAGSHRHLNVLSTYAFFARDREWRTCTPRDMIETLN